MRSAPGWSARFRRGRYTADPSARIALTARGALIYKYDGLTNPAVCVLDFGSDKISNNTFTVQFPAASYNSAILRIA